MADSADDLKALANACVAKSDFTGAVTHLTAAIGLRPNGKELWANRAFAWASLGRHEDALKDAEQCIRIAPMFSKGHLRAGRALIALGQPGKAADLLEDAFDKMPQDYTLKEALEDAIAAEANPSSALPAPGGTSAASVAPSATAAGGGGASSGADSDGGLKSSYYYAAVPASQRVLPVVAPPRIEPVDAAAAAKATAVANGHVREDIDRKGGDSYYYAHDRKTDFTVPTVPKKINADGSMTAWDGR